MSDNPLERRPPSALRRQARRLVPFPVRSGVNRLPHLLRWLRNRPEVERAPVEGVLVSERSSPLRRPNTTYASTLQAAKEHNVKRVARALNGVRIPPGAQLSWHAIIGPPLSVRGFAPGPELHDGVLARGAGGGACQVANLLFWLGCTGGLSLVERHRHGQDLFPDHQRTVPFGCGATVFYPHLDLRFDNPHSCGVRIGMNVREGRLHGRLMAEAPLPATYTLVEQDHRFFQADGRTWRANTIVRRAQQGDTVSETLLVDNLAEVMYPVSPDLLES